MEIGLADLTTKRLADKIDFEATYANSMTATFFNRCKLPMVLPTDWRLFELALGALPDERRTRPRLCVCQDTLHLGRMWASPALIEETAEGRDLRIVSGPQPLSFGDEGELLL